VTHRDQTVTDGVDALAGGDVRFLDKEKGRI
jgi:hypothetical protein